MNRAHPGNAMRDPDYWRRYPVETTPDEIRRVLKRATFSSAGGDLELLMFERRAASPSVVISPGSAGHAFVFAELGYRVYESGCTPHSPCVGPPNDNGGSELMSVSRQGRTSIHHASERRAH